MDKLFDFSVATDERLFHFLADVGASDISVITPHLTDEKSAGPSSAPSGVTGSASASANTPATSNDSFLKNLFASNKSTPENKSSDLLFQSLVKSEEKNIEKKKSILGELPKIDTSLFIDREYHMKQQLSYLKIAVAACIVLGFGLFLFFTTQLDPNVQLFGSTPNVGKRLSGSNDQLLSVQTEINFNRYRSAKENLDQFFYQANEYLQKYDAWKAAGDDTQKAQLLSDLDTAKGTVIRPFDAAREKLTKNITVPLYHDTDPLPNRSSLTPEEAIIQEKQIATKQFEEALRARIETEKGAAAPDDLRSLNELGMLVGNAPLKELISTDLSKMTHDQLRAFILQMSQRYDQRLAFIFRIKNNRIPWYNIITEIYDKTASIDKGRFKANLYKELGGIQYSGFDFEGSTGRLTISGNVKDYNGVNFTIMADLIDVLEGSEKFKDVQMRTFSKNLTTDKDGFEGSFKIDLSLQKLEEVDSRDSASNIGDLSNVFSKPSVTTPAATTPGATTDTTDVTTESTPTTPAAKTARKPVAPAAPAAPSAPPTL